MTAITEPQTQPAREAAAAPARQFVNFMFFKTDRSWRGESAEVKSEAKREFAEIVRRHTGPMMVLPYSTVGIKPKPQANPPGQAPQQPELLPAPKPVPPKKPESITQLWPDVSIRANSPTRDDKP